MEENILRKWSLLLDIPYTNLIQSSQRDKQQKKQKQPPQEKTLPNLVAIKISALDETFFYPACLIFISSSSKLSPTAMAGVNGLFGFNQGFTEDLGDKWHRWAWSERISNYWEYACPRDITATTVLDTLSQDNNSSSMINLLQKAINEPIIASPLMATKSVATPGSATCQRNDTNVSMTPTSSVNDDDDPMTQQYQQPQHQIQQRSRARYQSGLSLVDFAMTHFAIPNNNMDELPEYPELLNDNTNNAPILQHSTIKMNENHQQQNHKMNHALMNTDSIHVNKSMLNISNDIPMNTSATNTASNSTYQSPQIPNLELEAFGIVENLDVDSMVLDMPNQWAGDGMDDLDSFDFGVTEEDFDFFESGPTPAPPILLASVKPDQSFTDNDLMLNSLIKQEDTFEDFNSKELVCLDQKQQQHILDTDMENVSHDLSVTPLEVGMVQHDHFNFQQQQEHLINLQKQHDHHQMFVPPQFAPVKMDFVVNDAKYINGGKFTYTPDSLKSKRKGSDYQPDYIPLVRKKKSERRKSSKLFLDIIQNDNKSLSIMEEDAHASTQSLSSTSVSSTEESSTEEEDYSENESEDEASRVSRTFKALCRAQSKYLNKLTSLSSSGTVKKKLSLEKIIMDYDSPFARTIASSVIRLDPKKYQELHENEEFQALDYLCQQVVMGGYPFSGGIESMSSNGFEANEGESAKVLIARRRNLLQKFNGGIKNSYFLFISY